MEELKLKMEAKLEAYESLINGLEEDNKFKTEYEAKAEELKQLLNKMGCQQMYKFDSEAFIREMESLDGVEETPLDFEEFESWYENELQTERDLKNDL